MFEISYINLMPTVIEYLASQPTLKIILSLLQDSAAGLHVRALSNLHGISVGGVSDILRRLKDAGLINEEWHGNRRQITLKISPAEEKCLRLLFDESEYRKSRRRALRFSKNARQKLEWMDEAYKFYRNLKHENTSGNS